MEPQQIIESAIKHDDLVKQVALRLGKHKNSVYIELEDPSRCRYTRFLQLFTAIYDVNQVGAEAIFEDFRARVHELREQSGHAQTESVDLYEAVGKTVHESAEAIEAALAQRNPILLQKEITEAINALRVLNRIVRQKSSRLEAVETQSSDSRFQKAAS